MSSGHLLLSCAKRAATTKIDLFAYLWQLPCALCSLILMTLPLNSTLRQLGKRLPKVAETLENTGEIIVILKGAACQKYRRRNLNSYVYIFIFAIELHGKIE